METLAGIGALAIIFGIIRIIDWLFFQEERERHFREKKERRRRILQEDKERHIQREKERERWREVESFVLHLLNEGDNKEEVLYKLNVNVRYNFLNAEQKISLIDNIIIRNKKDSL